MGRSDDGGGGPKSPATARPKRIGHLARTRREWRTNCPASERPQFRFQAQNCNQRRPCIPVKNLRTGTVRTPVGPRRRPQSGRCCEHTRQIWDWKFAMGFAHCRGLNSGAEFSDNKESWGRRDNLRGCPIENEIRFRNKSAFAKKSNKGTPKTAFAAIRISDFLQQEQLSWSRNTAFRSRRTSTNWRTCWPQSKENPNGPRRPQRGSATDSAQLINLSAR